MEKQSININILGRQYPAVVDDNEAAVILKAAEMINAKMKAFKLEYRTQEELDISIMCCLDIMTEYLTFRTQVLQQSESITNELSIIDQKIDRTLNLTKVS